MAGERRLRILMTADTVGGVWQYALELARALCGRGDEVALATMGGLPTREQRRDADAIAGLQLYPGDYRLLWMEDPWRDVARAGDWLQALATRVQPDIVHLNDYAHGALDWPAPVLMVGHSCVLSWWRAVHGEDAPADWQRYRDCVAAGLQAADHVVAPTAAMHRCLVDHYGPFHASSVIHNGRSPVPMPRVPKEPLVFAAGRVWDEAKNLRALAEVAERLPWPVCIAGHDRDPDGRRIELGSDGARLRLLGQLPDAQLRRWLAHAAIYALPARYEPFGLSALEAALAGCALVLGDIPSLREVWGDAAVYVPPGDTRALEHALFWLIGDAAARDTLALRARERAARYTPEAMASAYRRTYLDLLPQAPAHGQAQPGSFAALGASA